MKIKKEGYIFLIFILVSYFSSVYSQVETNSLIHILNINYSPLPTGIKIKIVADNKIEYSLMRLKEPDRIVIDIKNGILMGKRGEIDINIGAIKKVRYAQFQVEPSPVVRVVVDLIHSLSYTLKLSADEKQLYILFLFMNQIVDMSYEKKDNLVIVKLQSTNKLQFNHFKLIQPPRIVLDLENTILSFKPQYGKINFFQIIGIRIFQFQVEPKSVVRVVVDLKEIVEYNVYKSEDEKVVYLQIYTILPYMQGKRIMIDAGHGGDDPGAVSPYSGMYEKEITLSIATKVYELLKPTGCEIFMTRINDEYISLNERVVKTKAISADIFISIHSNMTSKGNTTIRGIETYYYNSNSSKLAQFIHNNLVKKTALPSNGIRTAQFFVIKNLDIPAVLLEIGYMTNEEDEKLLRDNNFIVATAKGIYNGILEYFQFIYNKTPLTLTD